MKDKIIKEVIGEDFEEIRYHDNCYITVRECKKIMEAYNKIKMKEIQKQHEEEIDDAYIQGYEDGRK